ncbi:hypothetical protein P3X46_005485 [Hevea brasiliensis]|uniref:FRIGIDA-like protein n=1 Tax=Hevea brasiliensis TaxID=3981 RepID=A0ABQ9N034_HEVBR|nr:FRIGIDA-like protein 4a [Hevea brasiliensis]KAJ9185911.1 hypothetical protein P3X46_005485 [Hevea brasiliensis]
MSSSTDQIFSDQKPPQSNPQNIRKTFNKLKKYTSKLANFALQWQDLEDHFLSIKTQLQELEKTYKINTQQAFSSQIENPERVNGDTITRPVVESENRILESEIEDCETKPSVHSQNENLESEQNWKSRSGSKSPHIPIDSGRSLLLYLNEHVKEHEVLKSGVYKVLKDASHPGKVVLEALRFFYPSDSSKGDLRTDVSVTRKSCVVLLEELGRVGPLIGSQDRGEALRMALEWKEKMKKSLEVFGFLMLVAVFGLVDEFDKEETLKHFDNVAQREQAPELFRVLGFADKAHDFIQKLIGKNKILEAVPFIFAFGLVDKFPPVPLLRLHAERAEKNYKKICSKGNNSSKALDDATGTEIAALRGILGLIKKYELQSEYSPQVIRDRILKLKKQKNEKKAAGRSPKPVVQLQQQIGNKRTAPDNSQQKQQDTYKRLRTVATTVPTSNISVNTPMNLKLPSYHQEAGLYRGEDAKYFSPLSGRTALANSITNASVSATLTSRSTQLSRMHTASLISGQGAQQLIQSSRLSSLAGSFPVTAPTTLSDGRAGNAFHTLSMSSVPGQYRPIGSVPAANHHHHTPTIDRYRLMASTSFRPHMSALVSQYHTNIRNENTGRLGSTDFPYTNWHRI